MFLITIMQNVGIEMKSSKLTAYEYLICYNAFHVLLGHQYLGTQNLKCQILYRCAKFKSKAHVQSVFYDTEHLKRSLH